MSLDSDEIELTASTCASDDRHNIGSQPNAVPPVEVNSSVSTAEAVGLGDSREPRTPSVEGSITPVTTTIVPTEEELTHMHARTDMTSGMIVTGAGGNVGVRVFLKEISCLTARTEVVKTAVEPLRRYDGVATIPAQRAGMQPAVESQVTPELKQSIKETAELIRNINGDFDKLGEKLSAWIPLVDKKGELTQNLYAMLVTEQEERVNELKEQLHNVQQQLNHKNLEMELAYEEHKKKIGELSEELSRKIELEGLKKDIQQLDKKVKEHEKEELRLHHEIEQKDGEIIRLSQEKEELGRDLNNQIEFSRNEMDGRMQELEKEREKLSIDNQQQKDKITKLEENLEATRVELIEQLKIDKKHEMQRSDQMLIVIQKKILDSSVQEQLIQTILRQHNEQTTSSTSNDPVAGGMEHDTSDELHKNNLSHKTENLQ